jgi:transcriptional regulator with XRE-family HTH domain
VYFLEQEHRSPKLETIEKLARGLGVQPRDLLPDLPHPVSKRRAK